MNDFNFFEPYLTKGRQQSDFSVSHRRLIIILILVLAAWPLFNIGYGTWLKREAANLQIEVMGNEKYLILDDVNKQQVYVANLQAQLAKIENVDKTLSDGEWLNEPFFFSLLSTLPKDVQAYSVSVLAEKTMSITGTTSNKPAIAEFESNIRETGRFDSIFVETISNEDGTYSFKMSFELKDGEN